MFLKMDQKSSIFRKKCFKNIYFKNCKNAISLQNLKSTPGVRFTKLFRTELGHKYILVEYSVIPLCLPVVSKLSRYKLVCYK